jgi:hypothetical protein
MTGSVKLNTPSAGSVTLSPADTASNVTVTIPASTATLVNASSTQTLTNKTLTAAGGNAVEATSGPTSTQLAGMRNKIINGAMMIDQRNAGASVSNGAASNTYTVDRFSIYGTSASKIAAQQSSTSPSEFLKSLVLTSSAATSPASSNAYGLRHIIEGFNCADLNWGSANAKTVTLSFWVRSSITGTYAVALFNADAPSRSYVATYSINSANTFEYKTVTISGDTSGTWLTTNGQGIQVWWDLGSGSNFNATAGIWNGSLLARTSGSANWVGTNGATFYITGVQLEKGATATPFENRLYGTELALCQRYANKSFPQSTAPATNAGVNGSIYFGQVAAASTTQTVTGVRFPVTMRAAPTITIYNPSAANNNIRAVAGADWSGTTTTAIEDSGFGVFGTSSASYGVGAAAAYHYLAVAEL